MASTIKVDTIDTPSGAGNITLDRPLAGGGTWNLISTTSPSGATTTTVTGLDVSSYGTYMAVFENWRHGTDNQNGFLALGDSGGIDEASNDYDFNIHRTRSDGAGYLEVGNTADATGMQIFSGVGTATGEGGHCTVFICLSSGSATWPHIYGHHVTTNGSGYLTQGTFGGQRNATMTVTQFRYKAVSGTHTGDITLYGLKKS